VGAESRGGGGTGSQTIDGNRSLLLVCVVDAGRRRAGGDQPKSRDERDVPGGNHWIACGIVCFITRVFFGSGASACLRGGGDGAFSLCHHAAESQGRGAARL